MSKESPTPTLTRLRARIGAHAMHARHDPQEITANARRAFLDRFLQEADPTGELPQQERERRAGHLRAAYFGRLALRSAQVRRTRALRQNGGAK